MALRSWVGVLCAFFYAAPVLPTTVDVVTSSRPSPACSDLVPFFQNFKERFSNQQLTTMEQNEAVIHLINLYKEDPTLSGLAAISRVENPTVKEASEKLYKDPAMFDAVENWWRQEVNAELQAEISRAGSPLYNAIATDPHTGQRAIYSGYNNVVVLWNRTSPQIESSWNAVLRRATDRYVEKYGALLQEYEFSKNLSHVRESVRDPRRHHNSAWVNLSPDVMDPLGLSAFINREARRLPLGEITLETPSIQTLANDPQTLGLLEGRLAEAHTAFNKISQTQVPPTLWQKDGTLAPGVNAILRSVPTLSAKTYVETWRKSLGERRVRLTQVMAKRLEDYYRVPDEVRNKIRPQLIKDLNGHADLFESIPANGAGQKIHHIQEEVRRLQGISLTKEQAQALADYYGAMDRFDRAFLVADREILDPSRAPREHFGFDVTEQGVDNNLGLQRAIARSRNIPELLKNMDEEGKRVDERFHAIATLPGRVAKAMGIVTKGPKGGEAKQSGDDSSIAPKVLNNGETLTLDQRLVYYRQIVTEFERLSGPQNPIAYKLRGAYILGRGDSAIDSIGKKTEKTFRSSLKGTALGSDLNKIYFTVELEKNTTIPTVRLVVTPGYGLKLSPSQRTLIETAFRDHAPEGWQQAPIIFNTPPRGSMNRYFPKITIAVGPERSFDHASWVPPTLQDSQHSLFCVRSLRG